MHTNKHNNSHTQIYTFEYGCLHTYIYISMPACAHTHIGTQKIHTHRFMSTHTQINREIIKIKDAGSIIDV